MRVRRTLLLGGWFAVGAVAGALAFLLARPASPPARVHLVRPPGAYRPRHPRRVALSRLDLRPLTPGARLPRGRPLLVNLWAPWCGPCLAEWPRLQSLAPALHARGFALAGLAVATTARSARRFLRRHPTRYPVFLPGRPLAAVAQAFGLDVAGVPDTVLLSPRGRVLLVVTGELHRNDIRAILKAAGARKSSEGRGVPS